MLIPREIKIRTDDEIRQAYDAFIPDHRPAAADSAPGKPFWIRLNGNTPEFSMDDYDDDEETFPFSQLHTVYNGHTLLSLITKYKRAKKNGEADSYGINKIKRTSKAGDFLTEHGYQLVNLTSRG